MKNWKSFKPKDAELARHVQSLKDFFTQLTSHSLLRTDPGKGSSGQVLTSNGAGGDLSWDTPAGGGSTAVEVPVGSIMAYNPGYYTNGSNAGFTVVGPAGNTVADVNAYLPDEFAVCDGTAPNDSDSPIWDSASRYLPNLTDSRFLRGNTTAGTTGGAASVTLSTANIPSHTHTINHDHANGTTASNGNHRHSFTYKGNSYAVAGGPFGALDNTNTTAYTAYAGTHTHAFDTPSYTGSSGSTGSGSSFSIVPVYLTTYYIIRIK